MKKPKSLKIIETRYPEMLKRWKEESQGMHQEMLKRLEEKGVNRNGLPLEKDK